MTVVSIPRYAPLDNMALSFDGSATIAQAKLPASLLPPPEQATSAPFSLTFWMNAQPTLAPPASTEPEAPPAISGPMVVIDIRGHHGSLATWSIGTDLTLGLAVTGNAVPGLGVNIGPYLSQWVFVASIYTPPQGQDSLGQVGLVVSNGGPMPSPVTGQLTQTPSPAPEDRWLTVGNLPYEQFSGTLPDLGPFQGMIAHLRLWGGALASSDIEAHMYDDPIGPKALLPGPVIGDWRMNEGYGTVAFDYASVGPSLIPDRYQPPPGNHMTLGTGDPATEPAWVIADVLTLVQKSSSAPAVAAGGPLLPFYSLPRPAAGKA